MWMKWHHKFAEGPYGEVGWVNLGDAPLEKLRETANEECSELEYEYAYADGYRGIEYTLVENPPIDELEKLLKEATRQASATSLRVTYLEELFTKLRHGGDGP